MHHNTDDNTQRNTYIYILNQAILIRHRMTMLALIIVICVGLFLGASTECHSDVLLDAIVQLKPR